MAETLRELVVSLSLQSDNFSKNIKSINAQIKEAESRFDAAGAGVDGFATSTDGLKSKLDTLGTKLGLQKQAVEQCQRALDAANSSLEKAASKNGDLKIKLDAAKSAQSALKTEVESAKAAWDAAKKSYGENSDEANKLGVEVLELKDQYKAASDEVKALEGQVSASNTSLHTQADRVTKANTALNNAKTAYGNTEAAIKATKKALDDSESAWKKAQDGFEAVGKKATDVGKKVQSFGKDFSLYVSAPLAALGGFAYNAATKYESAFAGVRKTTDGTEEDFAALNAGLLEMSERVPISYTDLAGTMEIAGQLGVDGVDNLLKFTEVMSALGVSTNLGAGDAATTLARFANITGMSLQDVDRLGSVIVALGNNYATTEAEIAAMAIRMASAGELAGLSETDILALSAALSSMGIEAEAGGSAAAKLMKAMQIDAETGGTNFADAMGISADDFKKMWDADAANAMLSFFQSLQNMNEGGQTSAIQMLENMGLSEIRLSNLILSSTNNTEGLASALDMANAAWEENTALVDEATKRYETQESQTQMLANKTSNVASGFGDNIVKMIEPVMEKLNEVLDWFNSFDDDTQNKIITAFAIFAAGGPIVTAVGGTIKAVGEISTGIGKVIGAKDAIIAAISGPAGWATLAVVGVAALGVAIASMKSDMDVITDRAAGIELSIDETSKNETLQAIAEVRREIEGLSGGEATEQGAGVVATVKAGYGTSDMYGQALGYESTASQKQIATASAAYQAQIDQLNEAIVKAVEDGDKANADALAKQRDQLYAQWDAEVLDIKDAYTQSVSEIVTGMASQYPEAQAQINDAMEQYSAFKALNEYDPSEMTDEEMQAAARKLLGMDGLQKALAEMGQTPESIIAMYGGLPINILESLRTSLANSLTTSTEATADSPIYTVLQSMLSDAGAVEGLNFSAIDGALADGIALLDFKSAAEQAQSKGGEIGQYLTMGIGVGILSGADQTNADVIALRDIVIAQVKEAFGIASPSKVMAALGKQLPAGLAVGIRSGGSWVQEALAGMFKGGTGQSEKQVDGFVSRLIDTWTDGKKESDEIVQQYVDEFKAGTDKIRKAIQERQEIQGQSGLTNNPEMESDLEKLQSLDDEIQALLSKRQNGFLTEDEKARLEEIMAEKAQIEIKYTTGDGTETTPEGSMNSALSSADFTTGATTAASNLKTSLDTAITNQKFEDQGKGIGEDIVGGVAKGVDSDTYKVKAAMVRMAEAALKAAKDKLKIESPSRVMRDQVGVMIPRGAVAGIEEETARQQKAVSNAFRALVQPALSGVQGGTTTNSRTNHYSSTVSLAGANFYLSDKLDVHALSVELGALAESQQRALGRVSR